MRIPLWQVDAFAERVFRGNPAAVCLLERWLPDATLQAIAAENNLSETAFLVARGPDWELRWLTPRAEVDLCGHATLASAFVLLRGPAAGRERVRFHTRSGPLEVSRRGELLALDMPADALAPLLPDEAVERALGLPPLELLRGRYLAAVLERERDLATLAPELSLVARLHPHALVVTAPGERVDFVSRFFAPNLGVDEDPVTGSAHASLAPYWARRLGKSELSARQLSPRGGELWCEDRGERVVVSGRAVLYLEGTIEVEVEGEGPGPSGP